MTEAFHAVELTLALPTGFHGACWAIRAAMTNVCIFRNLRAEAGVRRRLASSWESAPSWTGA